MKVELRSIYILAIIVIAGMSSCATQYPQLAHRIHNKTNSSIVVAPQRHTSGETVAAIKPLALPGKSVAIENIRLQPQAPTSLAGISPSASKSGKYTKAAIYNSNTSQNTTDKEVLKSSFVSQNIARAFPPYHDGGNNLLIRGLIFILIGLLLQTLWIFGPIGFVIAIIGIVLVIYGIILVLESL